MLPFFFFWTFVMMHNNNTKKVVYNWKRLINITKAQIIPLLQPHISDELKRRWCGSREGAKKRERRRNFKPSSPLIMKSNVTGWMLWTLRRLVCNTGSFIKRILWTILNLLLIRLSYNSVFSLQSEGFFGSAEIIPLHCHQHLQQIGRNLVSVCYNTIQFLSGINEIFFKLK